MKFKAFIIIAVALVGLYWPISSLVAAASSGTDDTAAAKNAQTSGQQGQNAASPQQASDRAGASRAINNLAPNEFTPENYVTPTYDPFNNLYRTPAEYKEKFPSLQQPNTKPEATFSVQARRPGLAEKDSATVGTELRFDASLSTDDETSENKLQARWDFESDGKPDSYFSTTKRIKHIFKKPGLYNVTLEVLDKGGAIASLTKQIKIVENTPPQAYLIAKTTSGTTNTIFDFDTSKSSDSQYLRQFLEYRFDWNNDGIWDTQYKNKTLWKHKFEQSGKFRVVMEAKDPEGLTATYYRDITVIENSAPDASFTIAQKSVSASSAKTYMFDASASTDTESPKKLLYRWDFNYTGPDDIAFDTSFSGLPKHSGSFTIPGHKVIRLQVKDADGAIDEAFATIDVDGD